MGSDRGLIEMLTDAELDEIFMKCLNQHARDGAVMTFHRNAGAECFRIDFTRIPQADYLDLQEKILRGPSRLILENDGLEELFPED